MIEGLNPDTSDENGMSLRRRIVDPSLNNASEAATTNRDMAATGVPNNNPPQEPINEVDTREAAVMPPQDHQYGIRMYVFLSGLMALIAIITTNSNGGMNSTSSTTAPFSLISSPKHPSITTTTTHLPFGWTITTSTSSSNNQKKTTINDPKNPMISSAQDLFSIENLAKAAVLATQKKKDDSTTTNNPKDSSFGLENVFATNDKTNQPKKVRKNDIENSFTKNMHKGKIKFQSATIRWLNLMKGYPPPTLDNKNSKKKKKNDGSSSTNSNDKKKKKSSKSKENASSESSSSFWDNWNDAWFILFSSNKSSSSYPTFSVDTATNMIDKVLTSTPRIIIIANLLLAITYLLHSAVADYFLGSSSNHNTAPLFQNEAEFMMDMNNNNIDAMNGRRMNNNMNTNGIGGGGFPATTNGNINAMGMNHYHHRIHRSGRERLGGYLLFKLLLISAVVEPDSLDLLILSSWYTLLSFLRSLSHLCGATIAHTAQTGQPPRKGVCSLLILLSIMDIFSAAVCAALFHGAGWNMVLLLTCDCALLAVDILVHLTRYAQQSMEESHSSSLSFIEEQQLQIHGQIWELYQQQQRTTQTTNENDTDSTTSASSLNARIERLREDSRSLDREMELKEVMHGKRLQVLDNFAFASELVSLFLTFAHFVHIWSLHGVTFGLVDGVLALHLHSALSAMGRKILEKRKFNRIARDLDFLFEDATELDIQKNNHDVCCICLTSMSTDGSPVKKLSCGHMYHTTCLREVVERARSIEAAKCPLCRASVINGTHSPTPSIHSPTPPTNNNTNNTNTPNQTDNAINTNERQVTGTGGIGNNGGGEHALFGFSTEGILPAWIPIPAFSFEIIRRPPATLITPNIANNNNNDTNDNNINPGTINDNNGTNDDAPIAAAEAEIQTNNGNENDVAPPPNNNIPAEENFSLWRRFFVLAGILQMSPQEESAALDQLVDMFPQYERADLLMELRERRSTEAVVEAVLMGLFSGVPRQGALVADNITANDPRHRDAAANLTNTNATETSNNNDNS